MKSLKTKVLYNKEIAPSVHEARFEVVEPTEFQFNAGQFVVIPFTDSKGTKVSRCYSIASPESQKNSFDLCFNVVPGGMVSPYLGSLKEGEEIEWMGPMGHFHVRKNETTERFVFIATGTGIAPMKPFIMKLLEEGETRPIQLYFGLRHKADMYYFEAYSELAETYDNFEFIFTLSQPETDWFGNVGRVTDMLRENIEDASKTEFYLCGNGQMIEDVKKIVVDEKGGDGKMVFMEKYY